MAAISGVAGSFFDTLGAILGQYYLHYGVSVLCVGGVEVSISRGTPPLLTTPPRGENCTKCHHLDQVGNQIGRHLGLLGLPFGQVGRHFG